MMAAGFNVFHAILKRYLSVRTMQNRAGLDGQNDFIIFLMGFYEILLLYDV